MSAAKTVNIPTNHNSRNQAETMLPVREKMTKKQFDRMMATGLEQAKADDSVDFEEAFEELEKT